MSCSNSKSKCNPCGPSADAMNEIANKSANYARIAQYASNVAQYTFNEFNTIYLGAKNTAPTLDNDGNPLIVGALYFDTVFDVMYSWDGSSWIFAIAGASTVTTNTNQTITGVKTFTQPIVGNLTGNVTGNATTATTLAAARTFNLSGDVTGVAQSFNGSANVLIPSTIANDAVTAVKIINDAVITSKIQNLAVTAAKLGTNEQKQICKAWVNFNGTNAFSPNPSTSAIRSSYNVSSVTKNGTGDYTVNFTSSLADANYSWTGSTRANTNSIVHVRVVGQLDYMGKTTSALQFWTCYTGGSGTAINTQAEDQLDVNIQVFGN
jgi:hypothetical protein